MPPRKRRRKKPLPRVAVSVGPMPEAWIADVDRAARRLEISRSAYMKRAITAAVERDLRPQEQAAA